MFVLDLPARLVLVQAHMLKCSYASADEQAPLPTEDFAFPAEAALGNFMPTPDGSPEVKHLSFHEPGQPSLANAQALHVPIRQ